MTMWILIGAVAVILIIEGTIIAPDRMPWRRRKRK